MQPTNLHDLLASFIQKNGYEPLNKFLRAHTVVPADDTTGIPGVTKDDDKDQEFSATNVAQVDRHNSDGLNLGNYDGEDDEKYHDANPSMNTAYNAMQKL
jgi:hypothetical protein